jgi:endonuclease/exonuclease/phosphatase family metal-dependent hydrolase
MRKLTFFVLSAFFLIVSCSKDHGDLDNPGWNDDDNVTKTTIRIMTYNIHYGYPSGGSSPDLQSTAEVIKSISPDVALLQEVDIETTRSGKVDQLAALSTLTGLSYYYFGKAIDYNGGEFGVAILSKYELKQTATTQLPLVEAQGDDYVEQRVLAQATITFTDHLLTVATTHLDLTQYNRDAQVTAIYNQLNTGSNPVILGGDFNARPANQTITDFQNLGYTFTSLEGYSISNYLIDYIIYRPAAHFELVSHKIVTLAGTVSDHYPVVDELKIKSENED